MCIQDMQALSNALRIGSARASAVARAYVGKFFVSTQPNPTQQNLEILDPTRPNPTQPNPIQPMDGPNPWPSLTPAPNRILPTAERRCISVPCVYHCHWTAG